MHYSESTPGFHYASLRKKATIHQVTTMLATSENGIFLSHNHLLTTGTDDLILWLSSEHQQVKWRAISTGG